MLKTHVACHFAHCKPEHGRSSLVPSSLAPKPFHGSRACQAKAASKRKQVVIEIRPDEPPHQLSRNASAAPFSPEQAWNQLMSQARSLYLPSGYPHSVSQDYLDYQLWTVPSHVLGNLSHALTTSSLLHAVGISSGAVTTTAASAAIKWIIKDGIGAMGRFFVGGKLAMEFDDDPRRWRMVAEGFTTVGLALEVLTTWFPSQFLLLATTGNFSKAVGKAVGKSVFRVIQTHFAASNNVGAVSAKEEVWEVSAQLVGYLASVLVLSYIEDTGSPSSVVTFWAAAQAVHVVLRYKALSTLVFNNLNQKRAALLAQEHVKQGVVPSPRELNAREPMLPAASSVGAQLVLGCTLEQAQVAAAGADNLQGYLEVYEAEEHVLVWSDGVSYVLLKEGSGWRAVVRAMWQAAWLDMNRHQHQQHQRHQEHQQQAASGVGGLDVAVLSLAALQRSCDDFVQQARKQGWEIEQVQTIKCGSSRIRVQQ